MHKNTNMHVGRPTFMSAGLYFTADSSSSSCFGPLISELAERLNENRPHSRTEQGMGGWVMGHENGMGHGSVGVDP